MDRILYKEANGDLTCRSRDFEKVFPTLYAYEETGLTPNDIKELIANHNALTDELLAKLEQVMKERDALAAELKDERYRHDRVQDFEVAEAQELAKVKAERDALALIVKNLSACTHCKHVSHNVYEEPCDSCDKEHNYPNWEWVGRRE